MAVHAPQEILRRVDNALLAEYAKAHGLFPDLDIAELKQTHIEPLYVAIHQLEPSQREMVLRDLRNVITVADKRCIQRLYAALKYEGHDFPVFDKHRANSDKAMWALLHHPAIFDSVLKYSFPFTEQRHWHRLLYPSGHPPTIDQPARDRLSSVIGSYFREYDGRGEHCRVEHHSFQDYE